MKSIVQAFVLGIVAVGASAAIGSHQTVATPSHQTSVSAIPMPGCTPGRPCNPTGLN